MSDRELVGGEWEQFYASEFRRLVRSLTLYCGNRELAAELAQEAMARAWGQWSRVRKMDSPVGWVHRVAFNLANSAWRRAVTRRQASLVAATVEEPDTGTALAVRSAVASLPRRQRMALVLRYFADLSVDDVAALMQCAPETVRAHTRQGIRNLRQRTGLFDIQEEE